MGKIYMHRHTHTYLNLLFKKTAENGAVAVYVEILVKNFLKHMKDIKLFSR